MIWFNAVARANFILLFNTECSAGADCDNIAKHCDKQGCKRCAGGGSKHEGTGACDAKPKKDGCDRKCLRCSQNCRLELALLTSVNSKIIVIEDRDSQQDTLDSVNLLMSKRRKPENFNHR